MKKIIILSVVLLLLSGCGNDNININNKEVKNKMNSAVSIIYSSNINDSFIELDIDSKKKLIDILSRADLLNNKLDSGDDYNILSFNDDEHKSIYSLKIWSDGFFEFNDNYYKIQDGDLENFKAILNKDTLIGKEFIRTYNVLNVASSNEEEYYYITIRAFQDEEVQTVKIKNNLIKKFEVGKYYEFKFKIENNNIRNEIKSIFDNCEVLSIKITDKQGLDQINETFVDYGES